MINFNLFKTESNWNGWISMKRNWQILRERDAVVALHFRSQLDGLRRHPHRQRKHRPENE
jgi:hypothetical protein